MAMSSSMRRRSGLTTTEACSWDIEGTSRDEGDPSCSEPHPTPSSSHRLHQLYSTPPQALPRSGFVHGREADAANVCSGSNSVEQQDHSRSAFRSYSDDHHAFPYRPTLLGGRPQAIPAQDDSS